MLRRQLSDTYKSEQGFSLIELMIALVMTSVVVAAIYTTAGKQQDVFVDQDLVVSMQDNLRAAMLVMTAEIRMAGYDPTGLASASISTADQSNMAFTMDLNADGDVDDDGELIIYGLYVSAGISKLGRIKPTDPTQYPVPVATSYTPVAENISNLEFYYTMVDGTQTIAPVNLDNIRSVQITVLASTAISTSNTIGRTSFSTPSGIPWSLASGFRGRMQSTTVKYRNMGL